MTWRIQNGGASSIALPPCWSEKLLWVCFLLRVVGVTVAGGQLLEGSLVGSVHLPPFVEGKNRKCGRWEDEVVAQQRFIFRPRHPNDYMFKVGGWWMNSAAEFNRSWLAHKVSPTIYCRSQNKTLWIVRYLKVMRSEGIILSKDSSKLRGRSGQVIVGFGCELKAWLDCLNTIIWIENMVCKIYRHENSENVTMQAEQVMLCNGE